MSQDAEKWAADLAAAGWKKHRTQSTIWISPSGASYRGPYGAWCIMKGIPMNEGCMNGKERRKNNAKIARLWRGEGDPIPHCHPCEVCRVLVDCEDFCDGDQQTIVYCKEHSEGA